ncbi:MAG TPA: type II secretion system protein [Nodosilinea sp.]|nr:type II secretion system protein [Nodosilinea sp.]
MASSLPPVALTRWLLTRSRAKHRGFTLIELLVAIVVGSVIIGSLLYLVVELLGVNAREERLTQAQQDVRRALDYISRDVREAVYVYSTPADVVNQLTVADRPPGTPVLAFWRLTPINVGDINNADCTNPAKVQECETLKVRHSVYDLVIYSHQDNTGSALWSGPRRIIRYELTNYSNLSTLQSTPGYRDPSKPGNSFAGWLKGTGNTQGKAVVLADFIDRHDTGNAAVTCPTGLVAPAVANASNSNNFFVCVRDNSAAGGNVLNQSLYVSLRGNTADPGTGTAVVFGPRSRASSLPAINTEVQVRGVIEKSR